MRPLLTLLCLVPLGLCAAPAYAQDGVIVDPGSPAAREYAVPLYEGRSAGDEKTARNFKHPPPLFGAGVKRETAVVRSRPAARPPRATGTGVSRAVRRPQRNQAFDAGLASVSAPSSTLVAGGAAGAVLAVALLTAGMMQLGARRRRR